MNKISALDSYAIDFNHRNRSVCWISHTHSSTQTRHSSSGLQCADVQLNLGWILPTPDLIPYSSVDKIALDWATGNWYYLDESRESIFLCRVVRDHQFCKLILITKWNKPKGIALDPSEGKGYIVSFP